MRSVGLALFLAWSILSACGKSPHPEPVQESVAEADTVQQMDPYVRYTYAERRGKRLFKTYCVVCHGETGQGDGFNSYNLDPRPHDLTDAEYMNAISDQTLHEVIAQGGRGVNKSILMPAYGHTLQPQDIDDLVAFVRTLSRGSRRSLAGR